MTNDRIDIKKIPFWSILKINYFQKFMNRNSGENVDQLSSFPIYKNLA